MHVQRRVAIAAPPDLVWETMADFRHSREWRRERREFSFVSPDWPKTGSRAVGQLRWGSFRARLELTVTESIPGKSLHISSRSLFGEALEVCSFTSSAGVTTLWYDLSDDPSLLGRIVLPLLERRRVQETEAALERLKEYCERRARERSR